MHVFEMFSSDSREPLTVFATDLLQAERIYSEWIYAHHADWPSEAMVTYPYMGRWLHCRPELYAASKRAEAGVGVWVAERGRNGPYAALSELLRGVWRGRLASTATTALHHPAAMS